MASHQKEVIRAIKQRRATQSVPDEETRLDLEILSRGRQQLQESKQRESDPLPPDDNNNDLVEELYGEITRLRRRLLEEQGRRHTPNGLSLTPANHLKQPVDDRQPSHAQNVPSVDGQARIEARLKEQRDRERIRQAALLAAARRREAILNLPRQQQIPEAQRQEVQVQPQQPIPQLPLTMNGVHTVQNLTQPSAAQPRTAVSAVLAVSAEQPRPAVLFTAMADSHTPGAVPVPELPPLTRVLPVTPVFPVTSVLPVTPLLPVSPVLPESASPRLTAAPETPRTTVPSSSAGDGALAQPAKQPEQPNHKKSNLFQNRSGWQGHGGWHRS